MFEFSEFDFYSLLDCFFIHSSFSNDELVFYVSLVLNEKFYIKIGFSSRILVQLRLFRIEVLITFRCLKAVAQ